MATWQRNYVVLSSGEKVRFSLHRREGSDIYFLYFRATGGRRLERSTGVARKPEALDVAHRMVLAEYAQSSPLTEPASWEVAKARLTAALAADGKRPKTINGYCETLDKVIAAFPRARGPAEVTDRMAGEFKVKYASTKFVRKRKLREGEVAPAYQRKPKSVDGRIRTLKAVFAWFESLGLVDANPFECIPPPALDRHEVKYVRPGDVSEFYEWLGRRYPDWDMPKLFFTVKALAGCRLEDLCRIRSDQLVDGRLVFAADVTKNRSERYAPLPTDVFHALFAYRGDCYLWERYPPELMDANRKLGVPTHRQNLEFHPRRLYLWVVQLMQTYQSQTGRDFSSHDFRKAAFTRAAEQDIHPKRAAAAFDVTAETMLRYYTATEKKRTADEVLGSLADVLRPKPKQSESE